MIYFVSLDIQSLLVILKVLRNLSGGFNVSQSF